MKMYDTKTQSAKFTAEIHLFFMMIYLCICLFIWKMLLHSSNYDIFYIAALNVITILNLYFYVYIYIIHIYKIFGTIS